MHIVSLIVCYIAIATVFIMLFHGANKIEQERKRQQCMTNHPAGKLLKTEHLPTGQIIEILKMPEDQFRAMYTGGMTQMRDDSEQQLS